LALIILERSAGSKRAEERVRTRSWVVMQTSDIPMGRIFTLPRTADPRSRQVASDLRSARKERRWHCQRGRKSKNIGSRASIGPDIILVCSKLSAFRCDPLQIFLCCSIGIANLEEETFFTNGLTVKLFDDLFADFTALKADLLVSLNQKDRA
jgi:hypothetical protein